MENIQEKLKDRKTLLIGGGILVLLALTILGGLNSQKAENAVESEQRISEVLQNTQQYLGQDITLTGNIDDTIGPRVFTLDAPELFSEKLLVISKNPISPIGENVSQEELFQPDDRVTVVGTVKNFNLREIEDELGEDLVDSDFVQWEGKPVVLVESVEVER